MYYIIYKPIEIAAKADTNLLFHKNKAKFIIGKDHNDINIRGDCIINRDNNIIGFEDQSVTC